MKIGTTQGRAASTARSGLPKRLLLGIALLCSALLFWELLGSAPPVVAGERKPIEDVYSALREFAETGNSGQLALPGRMNSAHENVKETRLAELPDDIHHAPLRAPQRAHANGDPHSVDDAYLALRNYVSEIEGDKSKGKGETEAVTRLAQWKTTVAASGEAAYVGAQVCRGCHGAETAAFNQTLMGRIFQNPRDAREKAGCETCHGPGSQHLKAVGCAACHGEGGISKRPGMPSLVGLEPEYLVSAMKAYVTGQRKHELMRALLAGVSDAELNDVAHYYARQIPARAQTPPVGDVAAGRSAIASCAGCHGQQGISLSPAWPSLAGQDAQYLADAIKAYKHGARSKAVACSSCHGEGGISRKAGMPSLVGLDPQYLVSAMKAYVSGQRKHELMRVLLAGTGDAEFNDIARYYARQTPARAQTPPVGDAVAGKAASASCVGCHSEQGATVNAAWPSLAGQDARYLADALRAYKSGSRSDAIMKPLVASLDDRTINDIASYYASLRPAQASATNTPPSARAARDPVVVRNGLVANLDERTINNIASYYASLPPAQPISARNAPVRHDPILVGRAARSDGHSLAIISFRADDKSRTVAENNAVCLGCHDKGDHVMWQGSVHETRGIACTNCHTVMKKLTPKHQLAKSTVIDTCFQCHKNKRAEMWRTSHMPVREGKMTCTNCHNPHGSFSENLLREATANDNCYKCHAEKRGPFLWEHAPVRENCLNCHDPHGSNNDFLLKISRPRLCQQCHSNLTGHPSNPRNPFSVYAIGRECQNCHSQHHGSNSPAGARFQR
jgi:DmsE family decaheme c-type cytochrome